MRLAPVEDVRDRLQADDIPDLNRAIESALEAATHQLRGRLRTDFDSQTGKQDIFLGRKDLFTRSEATGFKLKLKHGFVAAANFTLEVANSLSHLEDGDQVALTEGFLRDNDRGIVLIFDTSSITNLVLSQSNKLLLPSDNRIFRVTYDSGFAADGSDPNLYDQATVPGWLKDAAINSALIALDSNPLVRSDDSPGFDIETLQSWMLEALEDKIRYEPLALKPLL